MRFFVEGKIVPAVRMTQKSKFVSEQAKRYLVYKEAIGWAAQQAGAEIISAPDAVHIIVVARVVKRRWDASNVLKAVEDALNHICWDDDFQIVGATILVLDLREGEDRLEVSVYRDSERKALR